MEEDVQRSEGRRSAAKRALRGAARPVVGYFNQRFADVHSHLDDHSALVQLEAVMHGRFEHLLREVREVRADVATDTDTIAELAFTLERFADLFTARMEEIAGQITAAPSSPRLASTVVQLPFAYAAAGALERGASAVTVGDDGTLSTGLALLGLQVTALEPATSIAHSDVAVVTGPLADWGGPQEPLDAVFALSVGTRQSAGTTTTREHLDLFRKWLGSSGLLVLGALVGRDPDESEDVTDLLAEWDIERRACLEQGADGAWRKSDEVSGDGIVLVRATPRP